MKVKLTSAVLIGTLLLAGCGKPIEEQVEEGIVKAEAAFEQPNETNTSEANLNLYLPKDFVIDPTNQHSNFIISSKDDQYILFVNEQEPNDSQLNYDLLLKDKKDNIVKIEELKNEERFGFIAVLEQDEKTSELVVSIGGVKLSTITTNKKVDEKLAIMMDIVRSVEITK